jgi:glycosyltransferase involved in cell wall biosynthesis
VSGIHHFVPVLHGGDAVGRHTLRLRDATRARGLASNIYVDTTESGTANETLPVTDYPAQARAGDVLVYQFATASSMVPWLVSRPETLVVNYHNITPPELWAAWDNHVALGQVRAQAELQLLVPRTALAVADSRYNQGQLDTMGFARTAVVPPSAALDHTLIGAIGQRRATIPSSGARWLSVGRVAPNKAIEDTIAALMVTRAQHDPGATLCIIGKPANAAYDAALHRYVADLGLTEVVTFAGHASDATVAAAYADADVLVVMSEHEGFCVPVTEAMAIGLPVVAFAQGALSEVLGDAGVLVNSKNPYVLAATVSSLLGDGPKRAGLAAAGRAQLDALGLDAAADRFVDLLEAVGAA